MPVGILTSLGVGAATAGVLAPILTGAAIGAAGSAITGGDPGMGALFGGVGGGVGGLTGAFGPETTSAYNSTFGDLFGSGAGSAASSAIPGLTSAFDAGTSGAGSVPSMFGSAGAGAASSGAGSVMDGIDLAGATPYADGAMQTAVGTAAGPVAGNAVAGSKGLSSTGLILGALSALGSATSTPKQGTWATPGPSSTAATQGPLFNTPLNTNVPGRTPVNPITPIPGQASATPWYTYGSQPEPTYFQNNQLSSYGYAKGGEVKGYDYGGDVSNDIPAGSPAASTDIAPGSPFANPYLPSATLNQTELNALFQSAFNRAPDDSASKFFTGQNEGAVYNSLINSPEYVTDLYKGSNSPVDQTTLNAMYQTLFGRAPDAAASSWIGQPASQVYSGLVNSPEYTTIQAQNADTAATAAQNAPPAATPQSYTPDMTPFTPKAAGALPGAPSWSPSSDQWFTPNGAQFTATSQPISQGALNSLYQNTLGRNVDSSGASYWAGKPTNAVASGILNSPEYGSSPTAVGAPSGGALNMAMPGIPGAPNMSRYGWGGAPPALATPPSAIPATVSTALPTAPPPQTTTGTSPQITPGTQVSTTGALGATSGGYAVANPNDTQTWIMGKNGTLYQGVAGAPSGLQTDPNTGAILNQTATNPADSNYTGPNWNPNTGWSSTPDVNSRASGYYDASGNPVTGVKDYYNSSNGTWGLASTAGDTPTPLAAGAAGNPLTATQQSILSAWQNAAPGTVTPAMYAAYGLTPPTPTQPSEESPGAVAGQPMAHGGAIDPRFHEAMMAAGGRAFDPKVDGHYVPGDSPGQADDVNAKLSPGEWVADANFLSALGDGNSNAGSKIMYKVRDEVMRDKGIKGPVPPKLKKAPLAYFADAAKDVNKRAA